MFKGLGNLASIMKNASQITGKMGEVSARLKAERVQGSAGGGLVEVEANGLGEILKITIDPSLVEKNEIEMIQDLLPAAINQAVTKSKSLHLESMQDVTGNIPGLEDAFSKIAEQAAMDDDIEEDDLEDDDSNAEI
jgi:DNA-binding YbaB/EbfC family protein